MSSTILTRREAKFFTKEETFPTCDMADIKRIELTSFDKHSFLGEELRLALIDGLADYSNVEKYSPSTLDYETDDVVLHTDGFYYKALSDGQLKEPPCSDDWVLADKFDSDCFNTLWCDYGLGEYLSVKLLLRSMPNVVMKLTGNGLVQDRGNDYSHVDESDRGWWLNHQKYKLADSLALIKKYITVVNPDCFEDIVETVSGCSKESKSTRSGTWNIY